MSKYISKKTGILATLFALIYLPFYIILALTKRYR